MLEGYNGTVMAYGQTGTGKTYTVGRLGNDDPSEGGIMVRALEHILSVMSLETDSVAISFLQVLFSTTEVICFVHVSLFLIDRHYSFLAWNGGIVLTFLLARILQTVSINAGSQEQSYLYAKAYMIIVPHCHNHF